MFRSSVPNDFLRSFDLATSPLETFTKTLDIWRTSSRSFSLHKNNSAVGHRDNLKDEHAVSPLLDFISVTCDLSSGRLSEPSVVAGAKHSPTSYLFPPFLRRTMDTFVNL